MDQGATGVAVQVTVLRGENLRGNRKPFVSFVRAEFNGVLLGDSHKLHVSVEEAVNYNFTCGFECSEVTHTLDDLAHKPVILTLIEIFPKEEKQKEEKTSVLGQAVVDLLPLLHGQCSFSSTVVLHPTQGSPIDTVSQDTGIKPTLEVTVSAPEPLLSDTRLSESNLFTVTVETAYSVPEVWNAAAGPQQSYVAALQVPLTSQKKEQVLLFSNGILKMGGEREPVPRGKKWPLGSFLAPDAQFIPGISIVDEPVNLEHSDLNTIEDEVFRAEAECNRKRVSWDRARRCFIDAGGATCLSRRIVECRLWPVEVMRCTQFGSFKAGGGKVGKEKPQMEDEIQISFHGVAYVDFAPLLYPGARRIRGMYRIHPFSDSDLLMKTKRQESVVSESMKALLAEARLRPTSSLASCKAAPSKVLGDSKEEMKKAKAAQAESVMDAELQVNAEAQMYADSRSYIIIEIALEKPLVPKRQPEELARRVRELIPPRPPRPRHSAGAEKAVQEYQAQIMSVVAQVLQQYEQMFGSAFVPGAKPLDPATQEQRKTQLFGELNCSGKYFAFKEQMKYSVVRIVREKMLRTEAFTNPEQLQAFLSQLYIFLVDEMHVALNKTLSAEEQEFPAQPLLDCSQLRHFAKEAQLNEDYQLAAHYYQEQLAQDRSNPSHWFDYGVLSMFTAEYMKAEECFHLAVSVDQAHVPSLLMCGILSEMNGHYEEAETFFERATCIKSSSMVPWTLFGLFYLAQENFIQAEMAFMEATKQLRAALVCSSPEQTAETVCDNHTHSEDTEPVDKPAVEELTEGETKGQDKPQSSQEIRAGEGDKTRADPAQTFPPDQQSPTRVGTSIYMETVKFLLQSYALQMAQRALAQELLCPDGGPSSSYHLALAQVQLLRGEYSSAEASLQQSLSESYQNPDVWALYGHVYYMMKDYNQAQESYERTLDFVTDASDTHPVYLRLGSIYLQKGQYDKAKPTYMHACKSSPSCLTWLGLGIACYRLGELTEAEDALTEANALDNKNPEVWGYLSLICLQTRRKLEAEQSYKYAVKFNASEALLQEITDVQTRVGFGNPCF
ncbi:cilia- and flagella-associated protein 70 isoform X1 [Pangasianodon hypophthalmus]|uniref:cilia- and flagella-associated protein 70 isoform X1 n=1 Tax=Pangasianodon hypophthalmus TaxID=310915 RepID=UPI0023080CB6|nr:cilia- and flagella-associated protein 70 isoform X1 [Pangasianodon hypophthalmus]